MFDGPTEVLAPDDPYEVIVVRYGTRRTIRSEVFLNYHQYGEPDKAFTVDYYFWIVRNHSVTLLVDTGFARGPAERRGRTVLADPEHLYRRLGIDIDASNLIVVTHAHYDHIGNLRLFAHSTVLISEAEIDFGRSPIARKPLLSYFTETDEIGALIQADEEGRLCRFRGRTRPAPGITVIEVGGHTPGQSMVTVPTSEGVVLLTSDAVHFNEQLDFDMPFVGVTDLCAAYQALEDVREMRVRGSVDVVITGHDAGVLDQIEPYSRELRGIAGVVGRV